MCRQKQETCHFLSRYGVTFSAAKISTKASTTSMQQAPLSNLLESSAAAAQVYRSLSGIELEPALHTGRQSKQAGQPARVPCKS